MNFYTQINNNRTKTFFLMLGFIGFVSAVTYLIGLVTSGPQQAITYLLIGLTISLVQIFISYFFSHKIVLSSTSAKVIDRNNQQYSNIYSMLENLSIGAGLPTPKLAIIPTNAINAFATGRNRKKGIVALTQGMINKLSKREVEGVIAHELAHIKNNDIRLMSIAAVLVGTIALLVEFASRSIWFGNNNDSRDTRSGIIYLVVGLIAVILAPIIAQIMKMAISRKREYLADATAAKITRDPEGLALALESIASDNTEFEKAHTNTAHMFIYNPLRNKSKHLRNLFSTHPPIEERIKILRSL